MSLLRHSDKYCGILVKCDHSTAGQPRMVFSMSFLTEGQVHAEDSKGRGEAVLLSLSKSSSRSIEESRLETPHPSVNVENGAWLSSGHETDSPDVPDQVLYIHQTAFMKLLGSTVDLDEDGEIKFIDREGFKIDPNN